MEISKIFLFFFGMTRQLSVLNTLLNNYQSMRPFMGIVHSDLENAR